MHSKYMLNVVPNCSDATHVVNNMHLTTYRGLETILNGGCVYNHHVEKPTYWRQKIIT